MLVLEIREVLVPMVKPFDEHDYWRACGVKTPLEEHYGELKFCRLYAKSVNFLSENIIANVDERFPRESEGYQRDVKGIGKAMRNFIERDLVFIKEHYN